MYSTTPQRKTLEKLCPYCGKTRTYTYRDGYDEVDYGTGRSRYIPSSTVDEGCDCMLGKLSHAAEKIQIKKQCANCAWNDLVIKNESKRCKHYELSKNIFDALIELKN